MNQLTLSRTMEILQRGLQEGLHIGGQLSVWCAGSTLDHAFGEAQTGIWMTPETLMPWFSTGKPLTAMAIAKLSEENQLNLDDPVRRFIPEFAQGGKESITLRQLMTHTGGFRRADKIAAETPWPEMIAKISATPLETGWVPGKSAGYHTTSAWFILAEVIQRVSGSQFEEFIRQVLLLPLLMKETRFSLGSPEVTALQHNLGLMHATTGSEPRLLPLENEAGLSLPRPGSSARGPVREITHFYQMLLQSGSFNGRQLFRPETVRLFTSAQRVGLYDSTFFHVIDFGLGFIINSNRYGKETVPYSYGRHASDATFGHSGAESSCAFADPQKNIIVAWVLNGMCGEKAHQKRARELNSAIYEDLGMV